MRGAVVVLSIDPGSRSLKAAAHDETGDRLWAHQVPRPTTDPGSAVAEIARRLASAGLTVSAVAHRVVHGGPVHLAPERIDDELVADLRNLVHFAPLHLPGDWTR
jgi:acetate kinase